MYSNRLGEVLSSGVRLKIADAVSQRPRTLGELAFITGISVQGVLRHLRRLEKLGLVEERRLSNSIPKARRVYASKGAVVEDYSSVDLTVAKVVQSFGTYPAMRGQATDLETMSADVLLLRRRVKDETKRLGKLIDEVAESRDELRAALASMPLNDVERLILEIVLTEETKEDGVKVLSRFYGIEDRRSIDKALAKMRGASQGARG
ncbi:MAG TPA: winged helix-turn-helix domain-containing protein [Nitrososphaerales archaeon]|nr:winged helix-turn-helix domain-containing protein [Nitrososphaerales archaeon]